MEKDGKVFLKLENDLQGQIEEAQKELGLSDLKYGDFISTDNLIYMFQRLLWAYKDLQYSRDDLLSLIEELKKRV